MSYKIVVYTALRISLGWIFLWAFIDKVFGLGFATAADKAWLGGSSPTFGFLKFATKGPLAGLFQAIAGNPVVDWLFMMGLLGIGVALVLGVAMRIASVSGVVLMLLMYAAAMPPEHNPLVDEHIIYALLFLWLGMIPSHQQWGLGKWWSSLPLVESRPWLR